MTPRRLLVLAFPLLAACSRSAVVHVEAAPAIPPAATTYASFLEAADDFVPSAARSLSRTADQRSYADALEALLAGRLRDAADAVARACASTDGEVKRRANELREAALMQLREFRELGDASQDPDVKSAGRAFGAVASESPHASSGDSANVPISFSMAGSPVATVDVNGHSRQLWFDTGASFSVLGAGTAGDSGVAAHPGISVKATIGASGEGHAVDAELGVVDHLRMGSFDREHVPVVLLPESELRFRILFVTLVHVEGIVGWDVLGHAHVEIDSPHATLTLRPAERARGARNLLWYGMPIVLASTSAGRRVVLGIDTGAFESYLTPHGAAKLGAGGGSAVDDVTLAVGGAMVRIDRLPVRPMPRASEGLDGVLANDVFSKGVLVIDGDAGWLELRP
jgi:predicted aspartyl protease